MENDAVREKKIIDILKQEIEDGESPRLRPEAKIGISPDRKEGYAWKRCEECGLEGNSGRKRSIHLWIFW
jgi:hypothetical protein